MIFATVTTKTIRDRWKGWLIATVVMGLMLWWVMSIYSQIDLSFYTSMPPVFRSVMNIAKGADVGSLAYGVMYASYGALILASLALAMGGASIAGEERDGTIGLLLANPKSRTRVLASKAAALVLLAGFGALRDVHHGEEYLGHAGVESQVDLAVDRHDPPQHQAHDDGRYQPALPAVADGLGRDGGEDHAVTASSR